MKVSDMPPVYVSPEDAIQWAEAEAARAEASKRHAAELAKLPVVPLAASQAEATAKPLAWHAINGRDYSRLELAERAREIASMERAVRRAEQSRRRQAEAARRAVLAMPAEQLAVWAEAAGATEDLAEIQAMQAAAEAMGVSADELAEDLAAERAMIEWLPGVRPLAAEVVDWPEAEAEARAARASRSEAAEAARAEAAARYSFTDMATSEAAEAARVALRAVGNKAAAVVSTPVGAEHVTIGQVRTASDVAKLAAKVARLESRHAAAYARLAEAEARVKAAEATKAVQPIRKANREADRIAAAAAKLSVKLAEATKAATVAGAYAELAEAGGFVTVPVVSLALAEAAEAASIELAARHDVMPSGFVDSGPSVKSAQSVSGRGHIGGRASGVSDPTGEAAAELADGWRAELAKAEAAEVALERRVSAEAVAARAAELAEAATAARLAAKLAAAAAKREVSAARSLEYKARRAAAARDRRARMRASR